MRENSSFGKKGRQARISLSVIRHGPKGTQGQLTETEGALELGRRLGKEGWTAVKIYSSPTGRNVDTAEAVLEGVRTALVEEDGLAATKVFRPAVRMGLGMRDFRNEVAVNEDITRHGMLETEDPTERDQKIFDFVLDDPRTQGDLGKWAASLAYQMAIFRRLSARLTDGTSLKVVCITHDQAIGALLPRLMVDGEAGLIAERMRERSIQPLEGFDVIITRDGNGQEHFGTLLFRGQEYRLDSDKFLRLVDLWKNDPDTGFEVERVRRSGDERSSYRLVMRSSGETRIGKGFRT